MTRASVIGKYLNKDPITADIWNTKIFILYKNLSSIAYANYFDGTTFEHL